MNLTLSDVVAIAILTAFFAVAVAVIVFQARRSPSGWNLWWIYALERTYVPFMFRWRSNKRCPFPEKGAALIIANHRSPVDPLMIWMQHHLAGESQEIRPISFLTAREYCDIGGFVGWMIRNLHSIPVERNGRDMGPVREALRRLKQGDLVGVFPEGGIRTGDDVTDGNPGFAWLALHAKVPVYPVYIQGAPTGRTMIEPFYTFSRVRVVYGDPIDLSPYYHRRKTLALLNEVTEVMIARLVELNRQ